jgi:excisionase family DNA binding protein
VTEKLMPMEDQSQSRRLFDLDGAASHLHELGAAGVTPWTLRRLIASGQLRSIRLGRRIYISREALENLLTRLERKSQ